MHGSRCARGCRRHAAPGGDGPFERYILSGPFVELGEIITRPSALSGGKPPRVRLPFAGAMALAAMAETWSRLTYKPTPLSIEGIRLMNARIEVTAAKARSPMAAGTAA